MLWSSLDDSRSLDDNGRGIVIDLFCRVFKLMGRTSKVRSSGNHQCPVEHIGNWRHWYFLDNLTRLEEWTN
jgi:hypothetical protein